MQYNQGYRCVYKLNIHLVLVTKYRKKIITQPMLHRLGEILKTTCQKWHSEVIEFNGEPDHVHCLKRMWKINSRLIPSLAISGALNPTHTPSAERSSTPLLSPITANRSTDVAGVPRRF
jgi:hypothetical protein